jgi:hypothetical protein
VPLPGSCSVLLAQPQFFAFGLADAIGGLLLPMALPADNRLRGVRVFGQAIASQAGGPMLGSFAPTARLDLLLGD